MYYRIATRYGSFRVGTKLNIVQFGICSVLLRLEHITFLVLYERMNIITFECNASIQTTLEVPKVGTRAATTIFNSYDMRDQTR